MVKYEVTWLVEHRVFVEEDSEAAAIAAADRYSRHNRTEWNTYKKEVKEHDVD
jgi:hypothetical protein